MEITYRKLKYKDFYSITEMITEAWFDFSNKKNKPSKCSKRYLYFYLRESNYKYVASTDNKVVGFIFGRYKKVSIFIKIWYSILLFFNLFSMILSKDSRNELSTEKKENKANKALLKNHNLDGELTLFIVSSKYRGLGIGSSLEKGFIQFMKEKKAKNYYIYTDDYSNYHFYDIHGYIKLGEIEIDFGEPNEKKPKYYIYKKNL